MTHDALKELLVLASEVGDAVAQVIDIAEEHALDTLEDGMTLVIELAYHALWNHGLWS